MTDEKDSNRAAYEQALNGIVAAVHQLGVAFETLALAGKAWDPDNVMNGDDAIAHATITSSRALMASIITRHAGAAQMLGPDALLRPPAPATSIPPASTPVGDSYAACAAAARAVGEPTALEQLRLAINADPSLAALVAVAMRRSAIPGMAAPDESIPT